MTLKVLLATTCPWFSTARLAMAFHQVGCTVDIVCPPNHPAFSTRALQVHYRYNGLAPVRSFRTAMLASNPDIVIPCDDLATRHLHSLYYEVSESKHETARNICQLLAASLGDPAGYPITVSREKFMDMVREEGVRIPETRTVTSAKQVEQWLSEHGLPAVLKADGTSGGEGVRIVHTLPEALRAFRTLHAPLATLIAAKRTFLDGDWNCVLPWLKQRPRQVSIQTFVPGPDANVALACWQGEVLAVLGVEVQETWKPKGPATIVRLHDNREILDAVGKIICRLKFSGLCGFDFIIDPHGDAYLIEMNARATQTCSLSLGLGRDLIGSLCSALSGEHYSSPAIQIRGDTIALFPHAWQGDTTSDLFQSSYLDVPTEEPELVKLGIRQLRTTSQEKWLRKFTELGLRRP